LALLEKERGRHFDPQLIDLMFAHLQQFIDIQERLSDSHSPAEASAA
jgi:response regulator RpfG family c-di-GMP phosphodiesterase